MSQTLAPAVFQGRSHRPDGHPRLRQPGYSKSGAGNGVGFGQSLFVQTADLPGGRCCPGCGSLKMPAGKTTIVDQWNKALRAVPV